MLWHRFLLGLFGNARRIALAQGKSSHFSKLRSLKSNRGLPRLESLEPRFNPTDLFFPNIAPSTGGVPTSLLPLELNGDGNLDFAGLTDQSITIVLGNGKGQFFAPRAIDLGLPVISFSGADLNGDGRADLATVSWQTNSVNILINKGDGTFLAPLALGVGGQPTALTFDDFNGDGKTDLAVSNYTGNSLTLFLGNGNGTFRTPTTLSVGQTPFKLVSGDFNGDGKVDLASALYGPGAIAVLFGNGNGTFTAPVQTVIGTGPISIAANDLNGDKRTDIACAFDKNSAGSVLLFQANGTFTTSAFAAGTNPTEIRLADINGDARPDCLIANLSDNGLSFNLNDGKGGLGANQPFALNAQAYCVATGDFNKDTKIDLISAGPTTGATTLFLGNGNATFQQGGSIGTGGVPYSVFSGDLNNDGIPDLVTANNGSPSLSVLLGNADSTFQPARILELGAFTGTVLGRDLNGDGNPDLVVTLTGSNQVGILYGNGNGTFQQPAYINAGQGPYLAELADINGDKITDLVVANRDNSLSLFLGLSNGSFATPTPWTIADVPNDFDIGDLNGDGRLDLIVADTSSKSLEILFGNTDIANPVYLKLDSATKPDSVRVADFNGDGKMDLATVNQTDGTVGFWFQNPDKSFAPPVSYSVGQSPLTCVVGDFNNDGAPDLATANNLFGTVSVLVNGQKGIFQPAVQYPIGAGVHSLIAADTSRDGILDLVSTSYSEKSITVLQGAGDGTFRTAQLNSVGSKPISITTGDFNKDGKLDWVTANNTSNSLSVALGKGNGAFTSSTKLATGFKPVSVITGDFNNDGKLDLASANSGDFSVSVHLGNGDGTFQSYSAISLSNAPDMLATGDFNKDGFLDLVTTSHEGKNLTLLMGVGDGTFLNPVTISLDSAPLGLTVGDFNKDGKLDLATSQNGSQQIAILLGNGNGSFQKANMLALAANPWSIASGDFNGDGKIDLVTTHPDLNTVSVLLGNGNGTFLTHQTVNVGSIPYFVTAADLNRDGKSDLITANYWKGSVSILLSKGTSGFETEKQYRTGNSPLQVAIGDFNGDQKPDLASADSESSTVSVLTNSPAYLSLNTPGPLVYGSPVTLTAKLVSGNNPFPPTGQITFKLGSTILGTKNLTQVNGAYIASLTLPAGWQAGKQSNIWAQYSGDSKNQGLSSAQMTFNVSPKTLALTATPANKIYDATNSAQVSLSLAGIIGTDAVTVSYAKAEFSDKNIGSGKTITVSGITLAGAKAGNYQVVAALTTKANITPKILTITGVNTTTTYGNSLPSLSVSYAGFVVGENESLVSGLKLTTPAQPKSKVGQYAITPSNAAAPNYAIRFVPGTLTVNKAALSILPDEKNKIYGAAMPTLTSQMIGLVAGDMPSVVSGLKLVTTATASSKVGTYSIKATGAIAENYSISMLSANLFVTRAALTITAENKSKIYGAALPVLSAKYSGLVNGDTPSVVSGLKLSTTANANSFTGVFPISADSAVSSNYDISFVNGTLAITPAKLTILAENKSKIYGDENPTLTAKFSGLVNGDTPSSIMGLSLDTPAQTLSPVGNYSITPTGATSPNYTITLIPGTLSISKKAVNITIANQSRTYGSPLNLNSIVDNPYYQTSSVFTKVPVNLSGLKTRFTFLIENSGVTDILADGFTFVIQGNSPTAMGNSGYGLGYEGIGKSAAVKFDLYDNNGEGSNSTGLFVAGLNPSQATGSINLDGSAINLQKSRRFAAELSYSNAKLTVILTDLSTGKTATQNYSVDLAAQVGGPTAYLGFTGSTGGFTARQSIQSWTASNNSGTLFNYPDFSASSGLMLNGYAVVRGGTLFLTGVNKNSNISTGVNGETLSLALFSDGNTAASPVGTYVLKGTAFNGTGLLSNYDLKLNDGKLVVNKAPLVIQAENKTKVYGGALPALTVTYTGLVNGETSKVISGLKVTTTALATSKVGDYSISASQAIAANYSITFQTGTLTVTKASLTITAENKSVLFSSPLPALTARYTGLVNGDNASAITGLILSTTATPSSGPGAYMINASGASSDNYNIQLVNGTLAIQQSPAFTSNNSASFTKGQTNSFSFTTSGFPAATFKISNGNLPAGLFLNAMTGVLSGNPTVAPGTYLFTILASNGIGISASQKFTLTIS